MKNKSLDKVRIECEKQVDGLRNGGAPLLVTIILTFLVMIAVCLGVFFASVQGSEQVMVPNVVGKDLTTALLQLQDRELYPKIQLKYSDLPGQEGTILEQDPKDGAIVKAYQRVTLTVNRGVMQDRMEDYTGSDITEVRTRLQLLFSSKNSLVTVASPVYAKNSAAAGTILAQYPEEGTMLTTPTVIRFVVSAGDQTETVEVPSLTDLTINQVLRQMETSKVVFDFTSHIASDSEKAGTITKQQKTASEVEAFTRISADLAVAEPKETDTSVTGIFSYDAPEYPYAVPMQLDSRDENGNTTVLVQFAHPGNTVTVPYSVSKNSTLILSILGEEKYRMLIQ